MFSQEFFTINENLQVTVLGSGTSSGVPMPLCSCEVCKSTDSKNWRTRVSILIKCQDKTILVDTSPDLRMQCLLNKQTFTGLDAVIITHCHADHLHGFDDLRSFNFSLQKKIPVYTTANHWKEIKSRFSYIFGEKTAHYTAQVINHEVQSYQECRVEGIPFYFLSMEHGGTRTLGIRAGNFAYLVDFKTLRPQDYQALTHLEVLIIDCVRYTSHPTHQSLSEALKVIEEIKPKMSYLTHLSHDFDYEQLCKNLPPHVRPAYDGLQITI